MTMNEIIANHKTEFLHFLKAKFSLFNNSNIFFRDFHFGLIAYLQSVKSKKLHYTDSEKLAQDLAIEFEKSGLFSKVDHQSWRLNYPEFALPKVEKKAVTA